MTQSPKNKKLVSDYNGSWENNRAFQYAISRGRDKAFSSMEDYIEKRDKMILHYRARRKSADVKHGERKKWSFELAGFWERLKPGLYIAGFMIGIIWFIVAKPLASKDPNTIDVFGTRKHMHIVYLPSIIRTAADFVSAPSVNNSPGYIQYAILLTAVVLCMYTGVRWYRNRSKHN